MPAAPLPKKSPQVLKPRESNKNKKYSELRDREYLLESEVESMMRIVTGSEFLSSSIFAGSRWILKAGIFTSDGLKVHERQPIRSLVRNCDRSGNCCEKILNLPTYLILSGVAR
jgi:hypothetical protein